MLLLKKNYFYHLYIFFLVLVLFFSEFSTNIVSSKNYNILDIKIEEKYDINFNKSKVINKAFEEAFKVMIYKLIESKDRSKINNIPLKDKKNLIENFSISNEQFINNNYISNFNVQFSKRKILNYLNNKDIIPSSPKEIDILLIPVLINTDLNELYYLNQNVFYKNWSNVTNNYYLINYILPNEDIEDINFIKKNIDNIEEYNFNEIISKYEIEDYIILILFQKNNSFNALMKSNMSNEIIISNKKFEWNESQSVENIINNLKLEFENQWKKLNIINVSIKLPITLSINAKSYKLIKKLETKLYKLDLVSSFYIDSINSNKLIYKIIYNSTPDKFINEFSNGNIKLNTNESIWRIE